MALTFALNAGFVFSEVAAETITGAKLNKMISEAFVSSTSGTIETGNIGDEQVTLAKIALNSLDGTVAKNIASADVIAGQELLYHITVPNSSTDIDITVTHKVNVIDVHVIKTTAVGGAGDQVIVQNGANVISSTLDLNIADKTIARVTTIDDANSTIAAAGTLRINPTTATNCQCEVYVKVIRVT